MKNVLHFTTVGVEADDAQVLVDYVRSNWIASGLQARQVNEWSIQGCTVYDASAGGPGLPYAFTAGPLVGASDAVAATANQTAALIRFIASSLTPPTRGRMYVAGIRNNELNNDGTWDPALISTLQALGDGWLADTMGVLIDCYLIIGRRGPAGVLSAYNEVTAAIAVTNPATQRRRRLGSGS